jgi:hypothetical protein
MQLSRQMLVRPWKAWAYGQPPSDSER